MDRFKFSLSLLTFLCGTTFLSAAETPATLSAYEQQAIKDMNDQFNVMTPKQTSTNDVMKELTDVNILPDPKDPGFVSQTTITLKKVKFDTSRLVSAMKKWRVFRINFEATNKNKEQAWTGPCKVRLYIGFEGCARDGRLLLFRAECTCITLKAGEEYSVYFFIPSDVAESFGLPLVPDYGAIRFIVDGISQPIMIIGKDGKRTPFSDPEQVHKDMKKRAEIDNRIMWNMSQLPFYVDFSPRGNIPTQYYDNCIH